MHKVTYYFVLHFGGGNPDFIFVTVNVISSELDKLILLKF